jgi:hypothetical protein
VPRKESGWQFAYANRLWMAYFVNDVSDLLFVVIAQLDAQFIKEGNECMV